MRKYLFIGAHPDDIELSAAGFLLNRLNRGNPCHVLVLGCDNPVRIEEQQAVFKYLDEKFNTYDEQLFTWDLFSYSDGNLGDLEIELIGIVEGLIHRRQFDVVITHSPQDTHRDHRAVSRAVTDAARKVSLLYFESANAYEFDPNFYVSLSADELDEKVKLMSFHKSQNADNNNYYLNKIRANAHFRAQCVYCHAAEAYMTFRYKINGE